MRIGCSIICGEGFGLGGSGYFFYLFFCVICLKFIFWFLKVVEVEAWRIWCGNRLGDVGVMGLSG